MGLKKKKELRSLFNKNNYKFLKLKIFIKFVMYKMSKLCLIKNIFGYFI